MPPRNSNASVVAQPINGVLPSMNLSDNCAEKIRKIVVVRTVHVKRNITLQSGMVLHETVDYVSFRGGPTRDHDVRCTPIAIKLVPRAQRRDVPCVDGSELARTFFTPAG